MKISGFSVFIIMFVVAGVGIAGCTDVMRGKTRAQTPGSVVSGANIFANVNYTWFEYNVTSGVSISEMKTEIFPGACGFEALGRTA